MSEMSVVTHSAEETRVLGRAIAELLGPGDLVLLAGELGAGKTQLAKGIADGLGVEEPVVSPTFTIAREYHGRVSMVHVDVYRLDRAQELLDLGLDDSADDVVTVVEWGDVASGYLPSERLEMRLELVGTDGDGRVVSVSPCGPAWEARSAKLARAMGRAS